MQNYKLLSPKGGQGENKKFLTNPNKNSVVIFLTY
jgi:hypothetical protein